MKNDQQAEALDYFRKHAADWRRQAEGTENAVNIIEQRNSFVRQVAAERTGVERSLDVGCGTGELAIELALTGIDSIGLDYAPEMIALATSKAGSVSNVKFVCSSVFDFNMGTAAYDLISANGFIEYISYESMEEFFDQVAQALRPGGSFVVGSRNRLFNLVTMNDFTRLEMEGGHLPALLEEAMMWTNARDLKRIGANRPAPLQVPETEHSHTGIDVRTRLQYSPLQLITLLKQRGLEVLEVCPIHIHGATPAFKESHPGVHASIANVLQTFARHNTQLLVNASTFMLHARKP